MAFVTFMFLVIGIFTSHLAPCAAQSSLFQPCPLLGPFVPAPRINASSPEIRSASQIFTKLLNTYVEAGDGDFGPITPNTTSFSIALFAGSNYVAKDGDPPFFYDFHHTASLKAASCSNSSACRVGKDSVYAVGALTQLFTVFTVLAELGDDIWHMSIVDFLPELQPSSEHGLRDSIRQVPWKEVTLGALAGHMAGIVRDSDACQLDRACSRHDFLRKIASKQPVYLPDTTPIFSNAAFQLLAYAMEEKCGQSFADILSDRLLKPLHMDHTSLLASNTTLYGGGLSYSSTGEPAALSLVSTINDLSLAGRAMLTSRLISPAQTRRWLKPVTSTSNLRNAVGRPWEIYHSSGNATDPVIDIYTKAGSIGRYSSYFGLAPDYDVGFAILAVDEVTDAPDLNAYADLVLAALLQIDQLARLQAKANLAGMYGIASSSGNSSIIVKPTGTADPGLTVTALFANDTDWFSRIADEAGITPQDLDFRLYPTNLEDVTDGGKQRAFRAVFQDKKSLVDAGTPTCITWMGVGELERNGLPLDDFIFEMGDAGMAVALSSPALDERYVRLSG